MGETLFGLYEGVPHPSRQGYGVGMTLPDRIVIYRRPIEEEARGDPARVRVIVRDTIWHEVAHHFGLDDSAIDARERKRWHS